jgi:hypothetical protein
MQPDEIRALGDIAGEAIGGAASHVHDMHEAIASRVFAAVGPGAAPVRVVHDGIARGVYSAVGVLSGALVKGAAAAVSVTRAPDAPSLSESTRGRVAIGALNGAFGDALERRGNALALPMTVRRKGRDVPLTEPALAQAFPHAKPRLALFVHGLCETDDAWRIAADRHVPYGARLARELDYTPIYVRYNSGRHISENGRDLAGVLDRLTAAWPAEVSEMTIIGHSVGGLVARSACHYGAGSEWVPKVRHLFALGAPHHGAPLERITNVASHALARLPETRSFSRALNLRSAGVKDLRYGYLRDEDWHGQDPDTFLRNTGREIPFLGSANTYFVCATVSHDPHSHFGRLVGDLLVLRASAWAHGGRGEQMQFPIDNYRHLGGVHHFDLLNHPAVYGQIKRWLTSDRALPAAV